MISFLFLLGLLAQPEATNSLTATNTLTAPIPSGGLQPLRPPAGTTLQRSLRISPHDGAPSLREIQSTDRVVYLRTQGPWYEVDLRTAEGLEYRGWLKGELPVERTPPPPPPPMAQKPEMPNPLLSDEIIWFWDKRADSFGSLKFSSGFQNIQYSLSGLDNTGSRINVPPGYNFFGWNFSLAGEFIPLQTNLLSRLLYPVIRGTYSFGFHRVSFSNPFPTVPEVAGKGYQINTNTYSIEGLTRFQALRFARGDLTIGLGIGFYFHEMAPDLEPIDGGAFAGQVVFSDTTFSSLTIPLEFRVRFLERFFVEPRVWYFVTPDFGDNASGTPDIKSSGLPIRASFTGGWNFAGHWWVEGDVDYFTAKGKSSSTTSTTRLGTAFTKGEVDMTFQKYTLGLKYEW